LLSLAIVAALVFAYRRLTRLHKVSVLLAISGIIGNAIDRAAFGAVSDFIALPHWPAFNLADSFIFIGVAIMLVSLFVPAKRKKK